MCGLAGIIDFKRDTEKRSIIQRMTECLNHRGPDATGFYEDDMVAFGHKRLSIIDTTAAADQPIADSKNRYRIIFNGEIYNYRDVKKLLPAYPFTTNGDTEVILAAFIEWGPKCLEYLNGMFAFAIWDIQLKQLFIARDRFGVKPLYYFKSNDKFLFASEIRSMLSSNLIPRKLNTKAVSEYLQFESVGDTRTIIQNIYSLEAGHYMLVSEDKFEINKYWSLYNNQPDFNYDDPNAVKEKVRTLLDKSVERRMVSDVPIGAFLSGGIDSSAIVGLMAGQTEKRINTFTLGFNEEEFDESRYADIISKKFNTNHTRFLVEPSSFLAELMPALDAMDTPSGDGVNSYVVSKTIRKTGITVALSGVGGDELFAGYPIFPQYLELLKLKPYWQLGKPLRWLAGATLQGSHDSKQDRFAQILKSSHPEIDNIYPIFRQIISKRMISDCTTLPVKNISLLSDDFLSNQELIHHFPPLSQISIAEYSGYTRNTLLKDMDQMSMAVSLEVREPFFDHELVEFVLQVPDKMKLNGFPKSLLVESLSDLLPHEIVHRKKKGFVFPWNEWMKKELSQFCDKYINDIAKRDFINQEVLLSYWKRFLKKDPSIRWLEMWVFIVLEYWLQKNNID